MPAPLRDYQHDAKTAALEEFEDGRRSVLIAMPTGLGKTKVFSAVVREFGLLDDEIALVVAHTDTLIGQAMKELAKEIEGVFIDREQAELRASPMARIVVGSVPTLKGDRLDEFLGRFRGRVRLLIIDEAHHATTSTYRALISAILDANEQARVLGVTATPKRRDKVGLGVVFERIAYSMTMRQAINRGYLVPPRGFRVETNVSLDNVPVVAGDFQKKALEGAVNDVVRNKLIVDAYLRQTPGEKAIVFGVDVKHAQSLADSYRAAGVSAEAVWGDMKPKARIQEVIQQFRVGEIQVLVNCNLLVEGFDVPDIRAIMLARPTKSASLYTQIIGRGTRPHPTVAGLLGGLATDEERRMTIAESDKPFVTIFDVVDNCKRHSLESLPSLYGLPPKLDLKGRVVSDVAEKYAQLAERVDNPDDYVSIDAIEAKISEVDIFAVPDIPAHLRGVAEMGWFQKSPNVYRRSIPPMSFAKRTDGSIIENYDRVVARTIRELPRDYTLRGNERFIAEKQLNVIPNSRYEERAALEVTVVADDDYLVTRIVNRNRFDLGRRDSLVEAIGDADDYIKKRFPWTETGAASVPASWLSSAPTPKQTQYLRTLGVPESRIPGTRSAANALIDQLKDLKAENEQEAS